MGVCASGPTTPPSAISSPSSAAHTGAGAASASAGASAASSSCSTASSAAAGHHSALEVSAAEGPAADDIAGTYDYRDTQGVLTLLGTNLYGWRDPNNVWPSLERDLAANTIRPKEGTPGCAFAIERDASGNTAVSLLCAGQYRWTRIAAAPRTTCLPRPPPPHRNHAQALRSRAARAPRSAPRGRGAKRAPRPRQHGVLL